jgi:hypothetical protein
MAGVKENHEAKAGSAQRRGLVFAAIFSRRILVKCPPAHTSLVLS